MKRFAKLTHDHSGWTCEEDEILFTEVAQATRDGRPLKSAFDTVAQRTGRRSNSVRNYYYLRIKDEEIVRRFDPKKAVNFVPFTDEETDRLLERLLTDQAKGISVRASTMALSDGDMTAMLRYQNKYRSLLRSDPELVSAKVCELRERSVPAFDPYTDIPVHRSGRPRKADEHNVIIPDTVAEAVGKLYEVEGLDVSALFENLGALAKSAGDGAEAIKKLSTHDSELLREENTELREQISLYEKELSDKNTELYALTSAMHKLLGVNKEFLDMPGVNKVSYLNSYINALTGAISECGTAAAN